METKGHQFTRTTTTTTTTRTGLYRDLAIEVHEQDLIILRALIDSAKIDLENGDKDQAMKKLEIAGNKAYSIKVDPK